MVFEFLLIVKASSLGSMQTSYFRVILYLENHQENKAKNKERWLFTCGVLSSPWMPWMLVFFSNSIVWKKRQECNRTDADWVTDPPHSQNSNSHTLSALHCFAHQATSASSVMDTLVKVQETPLECFHPLVQQIKKELISQFHFCSTC